MKYRIALLALAAWILASPAQAQYRVVASCPAVTDIQPSGSSGGSPVVDTKGNLCAGGSSGSTANQGTPGSINSGWPTIGGELSPDASGTFTNATQTTSVTQVNVDGYGTAMISINGTYGTGTGVFELSDDGGTTWYPVQGSRIDSCTVELGYTGLTNTSRIWTIPISGADQIRVRSTAVASGTINARISVSSAVPPSSTSVCGTLTVVGPTADGSASTNTPPVLMGGTSDGTGTGTADVWKVDAVGNGFVTDSTGAATQAPVAPATATATKSDLLGCQYNSTIVTFTNGQQGQVSCGTNGELITGPIGSAGTMATAAPTTPTFSSILAASTSRRSCLIQNTGTTTGYIYFGANGSATTSNSFTVSAGGSASCNNGNVVNTANVSATCASGTCAFVISSQ